MKRFFMLSVLALAAAAAINLLPGSALAADENPDVRGLWIEIPGLPEEDSAIFNRQPDGEGEVYFERTINDGGLFAVSIERIYAKDSDSGAALTPADTAKLAVRLAALRHEITLKEEDVDVMESIEELAELYTYPTSGAIYTSGKNDDARANADIFIFADEWVFRVHFAGVGDMPKRMENLCKSLQFVNRSQDTGTAAAGDTPAKVAYGGGASPLEKEEIMRKWVGDEIIAEISDSQVLLHRRKNAEGIQPYSYEWEDNKTEFQLTPSLPKYEGRPTAVMKFVQGEKLVLKIEGTYPENPTDEGEDTLVPISVSLLRAQEADGKLYPGYSMFDWRVKDRIAAAIIEIWEKYDEQVDAKFLNPENLIKAIDGDQGNWDLIFLRACELAGVDFDSYKYVDIEEYGRMISGNNDYDEAGVKFYPNYSMFDWRVKDRIPNAIIGIWEKYDEQVDEKFLDSENLIKAIDGYKGDWDSIFQIACEWAGVDFDSYEGPYEGRDDWGMIDDYYHNYDENENGID